MKKAFDQTVRDLKREVNKKVLKVPAIEQKILDATSNEPWGPHGSLLSDIAQATRNYHEYQIIMTAVWKRINDTGKNWRHVYKGLIVLEYLVAHGSERVIDEIREHAYQIATLSDFQYIDSNGRDQGSNVRKKSQGLVALVNDKERIHEVRQKAYANKDKYRSTFSTGGMRRPSSYPGSGSYGDHYDDDHHHGHYGNKEDDRNGYGRDRDWGYRDDDRHAYGRDGDRHRDSDERYGRDGYKNDDYKGNGGDDDNHYGSMDRNVERDRERSYDEDDQYPSRRTEHKFSERNVSAPPSYEEATGEPQSHVQTERVGAAVQVPLANVPSVSVPKPSSPHACLDHDQTSATASATMPRSPYEVEAFDEFDPRGSATAVDSIISLALVPVTATTSEACLSKEADFSKNLPSSYDLNQSTEDPFGDSPFKAIPQANTASLQQPNFASVSPFPLSTGFSSTSEVPLPQMLQTESFKGFDATMLNMDNHVSPPRMDFLPSDLAALQSSAQSHAYLQPNTGLSSAAHPAAFQPNSGNVQPDALNILPHSGLAAPPSPQMSQNLLPQTGHPTTLAPQAYPYSFSGQELAATAAVPQPSPPNLHSQPGQSVSMPTQAAANALSQSGLPTVVSPHVGPSGLLASGASQIVIPATAKSTQSNDKFETKSTVWADTLNRGLVNLNISGPKINPLADIGVDFDSINRKEKRREKERNSSVPLSTISMGKAMGAGSGVGRAGAMGLVPPPSPMVGSGMGMGMGAAMGNPGGTGLVMGGGYGGGMNNRPMGMGMGMGGVNMGMGQATGAMKPSTSIPPGAAMPGMGYNPMLGMSGYGSSQYGYR